MLDRQLGIVYLLIKKKNVTAAELAERYEVSVRTIYRDIEALSLAGFPVYARKGKNGGISLTEQFVLDKLIVSKEEQTQILAALESLSEVGAQAEQSTLQKLGDFFKVEPKNWVAIDFSDWSGRRQQLFEDIRGAILGNYVMTFDYYGQYGEMSSRTVEPLQLLFKEYTWYLRAFCRDKQAMRTFKVLRMKRVTVLSEKFNDRERCLAEESAQISSDGSNTAKQAFSGNTENAQKTSANNSIGNATNTGNVVPDIPATYNADKSDNGVTTCMETVTLHIAKSEAYRVYDRFDEEEITVGQDGSFLVEVTYPMDDWVYGMILSFGPAAEVLAPAYVREEVIYRLKKMLAVYQEKPC